MSIDALTGLLSTASGSVGDTVFSRNQHGPYTRARTAPFDPGSAQQLAVRAALSESVSTWRTTLTQAERQSWDAYALAVRTRTALGRSTNPGGLAMYVRTNVPRLQAAEPSLPRVDQAPTRLTSPDFTPITRVVLNIVDDTIHPFFNLDDAWTRSSTAGMLFYVSAPQSRARNFWAGPYRFAGVVFGRPFPPPPNPATIPIPFPAPFNTRVFVRFRLTLPDGRLSHSARLPADFVPLLPPTPINATVDSVFPLILDLFFDDILRGVALDPTNWTIRFNNTAYNVFSIAVALFDPTQVRMVAGLVGPDPGADVVTFAPPPFDLFGLLTGLPVTAFANFPIT